MSGERCDFYAVYVLYLPNMTHCNYSAQAGLWADSQAKPCEDELSTVIPRLTSDPANEFFG